MRGLLASKHQWRPAQVARRGVFQFFWHPKPVSDAPPPPSQSTHHKLWGAKTGIGRCVALGALSNLTFYTMSSTHSIATFPTTTYSLNPPPHRAVDDLIEKLEAAHHCTQQLRAEASAQQRGPRSGSGSGSFVVVPAYVPVGLDAPVAHAAGTGTKEHGRHQRQEAPRFGEESMEESHSSTRASELQHRLEQQHLEELIRQHCDFRLRRLPSTLPGAGLGLFLTTGKVKEGAVLTLYPGLIYRIPYDLEREMPVEEVSFTPCPPDFLLKNDYLLRFHHEPTGQHLLLDGCPRGVSALNFIKTSQRRASFGANMDWLESTSTACGLRPTHGGHEHPGSDFLTATAAGGGKFMLLPAGAEAASPAKYFTSSLGMGHISKWIGWVTCRVFCT